MRSVGEPVQFAICIDKSTCEDLELGKLYRVLPDDDAREDGQLRILDESGEDYLYPSARFVIVDPTPDGRAALLDLVGRQESPGADDDRERRAVTGSRSRAGNEPAISLFSKRLPDLVVSDLEALINDRAVENVRLEFAAEVPSRDETLKKLSAFANTFGGYLVVGARADSATGRITQLAGVEPQPGYKQKIVQWCFDSVSPALPVEVSDPLPVAGGERVAYVVMYVPESELAPHFLNGRKGVYVRTDELSQRFEPRLAEAAELRHLFDRRQRVSIRRD